MHLRGKVSYLGILVGILVAISCIYIDISKNSFYLVTANHEIVGIVKGSKALNEVLDSIKKTDGEAFLKFLSYKKVKPTRNFISQRELEKNIREKLSLKSKVYSIRINGEEVVKVRNYEDYKNIIEGLKKYYYPKVGGNIKVLSYNIKEKIDVVEILDYYKNTVDVDDAIQKIVDGKMIVSEYEVKEGDTIWNIALDNDVSIEDIRLVNPELNIDKIKIGQKIKIVKKKPYVNVEIVAMVSSSECIPYDTKKIIDKNLKKGIQKVKEKGQNGVAYVEKKIVVLNDDVVEEDIVLNKIVKQPKDEVLVLGAKKDLYVAFNGFIRPSRGVVTSRFGYRWGRMHEGVDIAASTGTPIYAAASGRVIFAGWKSGYGKCVIINHGNGYQTVYGHASTIYVRSGQYINKGERIAAVGSTGRSTGPHLHFEVRKNGIPQNPLKYIK